jgi:hypothetical protein
MCHLMLIPDLAEEVDAVLAREKCRGNRVNRRVAPTLFHTQSRLGKRIGITWFTYLVVKSACALEVIKVRAVGFASPKV